jgi:hypothetical protein
MIKLNITQYYLIQIYQKGDTFIKNILRYNYLWNNSLICLRFII